MEFAEAVERMKEELFSPSADLIGAFMPVSAYETAWVAMVPDPDDPTRPMFPECLYWVLRSQNSMGFWVEVDDHEQQSDLMATLACLLALNTWEPDHANYFSHKINKGLKFLRENMEKELMMMKMRKSRSDVLLLRRWVLMLELAKAKGLKLFPPQQIINSGLFDEFKLNGTNLKIIRELEDEIMIIDERVVMREMAFENGGSELLFRSPSVTACAFMITGDEAYKTYLYNLLADCQHGVPPIYLVDKNVLKLCVVDHLERLGCAEHFTEEIRDVMDNQYRKWIAEESKIPKKYDIAFQIYKDSLAFRLLRMHGYQVSPRKFCWFIDDEEMLSHIKDNYAFFLGPMLSIYKASHIAFPEDHKLDKAGVFSQQILQIGITSMKSQNDSNISAISTNFEQE